MVLAVLAQVLVEVVDPLGQERDLDLGLAGVARVVAEPGDQLLLAFLGDSHRPAEASRPPAGRARGFAARRSASARSAPRASRSGARPAAWPGSRFAAPGRTDPDPSPAGRPRLAAPGRSRTSGARRC